MQIATGLDNVTTTVRQNNQKNATKASKEADGQTFSGVSEEAQEPKDTVTDVGPLSGDAGQRIGKFVRNVAYESMQHTRYLAGAAAFSNVASALGSQVATPLAIKFASENAAVVGGVAIGGTVALGAIGGVLGYLWVRNQGEKAPQDEKPSVFGKVADASLDAASALKALPSFIYPSVYGATEAQRQVIYNALDELPLEDATASATMTVVPDLLKTGISGMSQPGTSHVRILLDQSYLDRPELGRGLVFHENGHAVDYSGGFGLLGSNNWHGKFGKGPFVSKYASSNRYEDWAETYEQFHKDPTKLQAIDGVANKVKVIERVNGQGPLNQMIDTPKTRTAGKRLGEALGTVPYLRDALEVAGSLVGPVQIYRGAGELVKGWETDDKRAQLHGKLNLATGLFLTLPGASPLALVSSGVGSVLKASAGKDDEAGLKDANKLANAVLGMSAGPVGMTLAAVGEELLKNGLRFDDAHGFSAEGWKAAKPGKTDMLKGTLLTVGGAVGGSIVGASLGAFLNGGSGAAVGGVWGQLAGAAGGLAVYGIGRTLKASKKNQDPLALTSGDKKFLGGLVGGAILGGGVGTAAGTLAGKTAGELLGGFVAGPTGASVGGTVGGWGGALAGAFGGAKLGAAIGSGRLRGKAFPSLAREPGVKA